MLIYYGTLIVMALLCFLVYVWGHQQQIAAARYRRSYERCQGKQERSSASAQQWMDEARRLRKLVDRVEG